jgi:serine beta-lactamase-like protein LACTB, mitochondrial
MTNPSRVLVALLILPGALGAQHPRADSAIAQFMVEHHVPGMAVALVVHGALAWSAGYGMADLENLVPVTPQTLFRLGSVSKPITAVAALQLSERGKLDLDAPVQRYCPSFPQKPWPITTRELLAHLGGIRHYKSGPGDLETDNTRHFADGIAGGIAFFAADTLIAKPGTRYNYSTMGYTLVGCAIAHAAGEAYTDYVRENVFLPADMMHTVVDDRFAIIPNRTRFYHRDSTGQTVNAEFLDASYKVPGGGWLSDANDLAHFEIALLHDALLKRSTRAMMWTEQKTTGDSLTGYGLGWGVPEPEGCPHCVAHTGGQQGTTTMIVIEPDQQFGVVILTNMDAVPIVPLARSLRAIVSSDHQ